MLATGGIAAVDGASGDAAAGGSLFGERIQETRLNISQVASLFLCDRRVCPLRLT